MVRIVASFPWTHANPKHFRPFEGISAIDYSMISFFIHTYYVGIQYTSSFSLKSWVSVKRLSE